MVKNGVPGGAKGMSSNAEKLFAGPGDGMFGPGRSTGTFAAGARGRSVSYTLSSIVLGAVIALGIGSEVCGFNACCLASSWKLTTAELMASALVL